MSEVWTEPIIITGAGLVGLLAAQMFKKNAIPFIILDRDESINSRGQGWGITLHWALNDFLSMLPEEIRSEIYSCQVLENFNEEDSGNFLYLNAGTGETVVKIPPSRRLRVRREQVRRTLSKGIDIHWDSHVLGVSVEHDGCKVKCKNGKIFEGSMILDCEGNRSKTRQFTNPDNHQVYQLPIKFLGCSIDLTKDEYEKLASKFDPLLFQGTIPTNETFFWFSLLSTPSYNKTEFYRCQINFSWKQDNSPFESAEDKLKVLEKISTGLCDDLDLLRSKMLKQNSSNNANILEITLADWPIVEWNDYDGKILLAGDAAHAMVMYRGEAGNHGIADIKLLETLILEFKDKNENWSQFSKIYQNTIRKRAKPAVLLSRQACLDAHNWSMIKPDSESPLLTLRKKE